MKSTIFKVLSSGATFFALCASASACNTGGGNRSNSAPSYNSYPSQYSTVNMASTVPIAARAPAVVATPAPAVAAAPQARISVVATNNAPVGNLQLASPVPSKSEPVSKIEEVAATEVKASTEIVASTPASGSKDSTDLDLSKVLDAPSDPPVEASKIAEAIKGLVGTWMAVSRQSDGGLSTVELQMDDQGWAKLTVPGKNGKSSTTTRKVEFDNNELKLTGDDADVMLGKLVTFDARQMVLERSGGQVTFVRP